MKNFQDAIKKYLDNRAATDELFAAAYAKEDKVFKGDIIHFTDFRY